MARTFLLVLALAAVAHGGPPKEVRAAIADLRSRDEKRRFRGAKELERLGPIAADAVPYLVKALGRQDLGLRWAARDALAAIGKASVPALAKALRHRDADVRALVCDTLATEKLIHSVGPYADKVAVALGDRSAWVRRRAVALFGALGAAGIDALLETLDDSDPDTHEAAVAALALAGIHGLPRLGEAVRTSEHPRVRTGVCEAVGRMGSKGAPAGEALVAALADPVVEVRAEAARALGRTGALYADAKARLLAGLTDESEPMREGCIDGLAAYGDRSVDDLVGRLVSDDAAEHRSTEEALYRMGRAAVAPLQAALNGGDANQRRGAIDVLVRFGRRAPQANTRPGLRACLRAKEPRVRAAAAAALGRLGRPRFACAKGASAPTEDALLVAAKDDDAAVRAAALGSLGRLGCMAARETVAKARADKDARVRIAAHVALWGVGGGAEEALAGLRKELAGDKTRVAAAGALRGMGIAAAPATPELVALLDSEKPAHRRAAAEALGRIVRPGRLRTVEMRGTWRDAAPADVKKAVEAGLGWLVRNRNAVTGGWESEKHGGGKLYDEGVTGLAVWALLAAGEPHPDALRDGLGFLLRRQADSGLIANTETHSFLCCHAIAGLALAEAWFLTAHPRYRSAVEGAVEIAELARNPFMAWRYEPRGGENDTHMTTWMVTLLRFADLGGIDVDPAAYEGASQWLLKMTDPNTGKTGYNYPGSYPARPKDTEEAFPREASESMTAAAFWCRELIGATPTYATIRNKVQKMRVELCVDAPPRPDLEARDQYYHQFGALAVFQGGRGPWRKWREPLHDLYIKTQDDDGSWPPVGVWGRDGGRVYSTAMAVLALLAPYRYPREFASDPRPLPAEREAISELRRAAKDDDPSVAAAATEALHRITRE